MKTLKSLCYKGTAIRYGNEKRQFLNKITEMLMRSKYEEIEIPVLQKPTNYDYPYNSDEMKLIISAYDKDYQEVYLAPEYKSIMKRLSKDSEFKWRRDVKLFSIQKCFHDGNQQHGHWKEFTQIEVDVLNPLKPEKTVQKLIDLAVDIVSMKVDEHSVHTEEIEIDMTCLKSEGQFEIRNAAGSQLCYGGHYDEGFGFSIFLDRLFLKYEVTSEPIVYSSSNNYGGFGWY